MYKLKDEDKDLCSCKNCCFVSTRSKVVCAEKKCEIIFNNDNKENILKLKIDGCILPEDFILPDGTKPIRCDYYVCTNSTEYFIELKGSDINHAIEQIKATLINKDILKSIKYYRTDIPLNPTKKEGYIICSQIPASSSSALAKIKKHNDSSDIKLKMKARTHTV